MAKTDTGELPATMRLYSVKVPAGEYCAIKALADLLFWNTPPEMSTDRARRQCVLIAIKARAMARAIPVTK